MNNIFGEKNLIFLKFVGKKNVKKKFVCFFFLADFGEARGCSTNSFVINWLSNPLFKISLRCRHALMVEDGAFSHKIDYFTFFLEILNL